MIKNFSVIAAVDDHWGIGKDGEIPWRYSEDFQWFKKTTMGATCFMGRRTYNELAIIMKGKKEILPGRKCVVFTTLKIDDPRITVCDNVGDYENYTKTPENFFIGGSSIFEFGLQICDTAYITAIPGDRRCDVRFPYRMLETSFSINREITLSEELKVKVYGRNGDRG